jgi:hypothetical protein
VIIQFSRFGFVIGKESGNSSSAPTLIVSYFNPASGKTGMFLNGSDVRIARGACDGVPKRLA